MLIHPACDRCVMHLAGIVCAVAVWLICPAEVSASCGDYLQGRHLHGTPIAQPGLPSNPAPLPPCRCHGVECQPTPFAPLPTELPIPRGIVQPAWWMSSSLSQMPAGGFPTRVGDEVFDLLTVDVVEHVPITTVAAPV